MAETNTRQASRAPVTLKIKFKSETLDQFIERYSVDISHGGIFIRTKEPLAVGTELKFEFQLKDATPLIAGDGTVVWTREHDPNRTGVSPGMGVRFDKLPGDSQKVLDKVLAKKEGSTAAQAEAPEEEDDPGGFGDDFVDTPTRVAPADLVDSLNSDAGFDDNDMTPLPKPMPFHGDVGDFSDEAFEESTKVASLDSILAQAKSTEEDSSDYDEDAVFASTPPPAAAPTVAESDEVDEDAYEDPFGDLNEDDDDEEAEEDRAPTEAIDKESAPELEPAPDVGPAEDEDEENQDEDDDEDDDEEEEDDEDQDEEDDEPVVAKAAVAEAVAESESGSSMPWIAVAAVILLIAGGTAFWLLGKGDKEEPVEAQAVPVVVAMDAAKVDETAIKDPIKDPTPPEPDVEEPPDPVIAVAFTTVPEGATLSIEGSDVTATAPASLDLPEGTTSTVVISHPGFTAQSIEVTADGTPLETITLVELPKVLRFTSTPPGAKVFVNGQKLPGVTPLTFPFNLRIARRAKISVQYRLPGHKLWSANLPSKADFVAEDDSMVRTIDGSLAPFPKRPQRPKNTGGTKKPNTDTPPDTTGTGDPPEDGPPGDPQGDPPKDDPPKDDPPKDDPPKGDPPKGDGEEPTPDWMK